MPTRELVSRDLHRVELAGGWHDYTLARRRGRRGVGFKVDASGLTVSAPLTMPMKQVEALVRQSEAWIVRKLAEWRERQVPEASWSEGARIPFLGGGLALRLFTGRTGAVREGQELWVRTAASTPDQVKRAVVAWYKAQAREHLARRTAELSAAAGYPAPTFALSSAMGRWGSCNTRREIRLTWRLMKAPPELIDYVACHELAHLRHMNHSPAFWAEVERQCPDYRALRDRLHAIDHLYRSF